MMRWLFQVFILGLISQLAVAEVWYVSGTGSDTNDGKTTRTAFRSLQKAAEQVQPGDVVLIGNGIYAGTEGETGPVLTISRSGRSDAWITWKAQPGHRPEIRPSGWAGIQITGSYHILDGLTVTGANDSLVLLRALEDAKKPKPDPRFNTNGIIIEGRRQPVDQKPHHVVIRNCQVSKCPGGGITGLETDYLTIEDCLVFDNAWYMRYAGSGITTLNNWAFDDKPGYHIIIQRNYVWNNKTLVPWERTGKLSDGNGILLDVTDLTQQGATNPNADAVVAAQTARKDSAQAVPASPPKSQRPEWKGRALIANNVSAYNGGSGIHTFRTRHVDIVNNTTYWNGQVVGYEELFPNRSDDIVIMNNIIVPHPGGKVTSNNRNTNIRWDYNLYPAAQQVFVGPNDRIADPLFVNVQPDLRKADFRLQKTSPGYNSGGVELPLTTDITGKARPKASGRDRGAYEQ
ncbi:right-handed parallel beta-helix repeat-containing protein [Fibrisoma montanum]|nr:right-handed parallel beta-helix repeat-containing protein [Fibrisoma montanum]